SVWARRRPTAQAPGRWVANWHVVLLDDVDTRDHREEHTQEDPASTHGATDRTAARSVAKCFAGSSRICHLWLVHLLLFSEMAPRWHLDPDPCASAGARTPARWSRSHSERGYH